MKKVSLLAVVFILGAVFSAYAVSPIGFTPGSEGGSGKTMSVFPENFGEMNPIPPDVKTIGVSEPVQPPPPLERKYLDEFNFLEPILTKGEAIFLLEQLSNMTNDVLMQSEISDFTNYLQCLGKDTTISVTLPEIPSCSRCIINVHALDGSVTDRLEFNFVLSKELNNQLRTNFFEKDYDSYEELKDILDSGSKFNYINRANFAADEFYSYKIVYSSNATEFSPDEVRDTVSSPFSTPPLLRPLQFFYRAKGDSEANTDSIVSIIKETFSQDDLIKIITSGKTIVVELRAKATPSPYAVSNTWQEGMIKIMTPEGELVQKAPFSYGISSCK